MEECEVRGEVVGCGRVGVLGLGGGACVDWLGGGVFGLVGWDGGGWVRVLVWLGGGGGRRGGGGGGGGGRWVGAEVGL